MPTVDSWTIKPAAARIAVEVVDETAERMRDLGLVIPNRYQGDKPVFGQVTAVCENYVQDGEEFDPIYPVGTWVLFGKFVGTEVQVGQRRVIVLRENDIIATLHPPAEAGAVELPRVKINARN